jgi:hypothetical protein
MEGSLFTVTGLASDKRKLQSDLMGISCQQKYHRHSMQLFQQKVSHALKPKKPQQRMDHTQKEDDEEEDFIF